MQRKQLLSSQQVATPWRTGRQTSASAGASKGGQQHLHDPSPRPYRFDERASILGSSSAAGFAQPSARPLMSSAVAGGSGAHAEGAASAPGDSPPSSRGPSTADLERPASTRPPVPSASLRRLRTITDLHALMDPAAQLPAPSSASPELVLSRGGGGGPLALTRPQASSNVVPGPGSRSAVRQQCSAPAAVPDELCCAAEAAEEPAACTGVTVFCMMPLDTVKP